ncbi:MAG: hypothetical protein U0414_41590 [Polyangiaceae bacterium]
MRSNRLTSWLLPPVALAIARGGALVAPGCESEAPDDTTKPPEVHVTPPPGADPYEKLSDWHLFRDAATQTPADDLVPYEVNSPLFSDYTTKFRFAYVPKGAAITYSASGQWELPVGSVLVKTFSYHADLRDPKSPLTILETRLLWRQPSGWTVHTYIWDAALKDAIRNVVGPKIPSTFIDASGATVTNEYTVPNTEECKKCHSRDNVVSSIGWKTRELNRAFSYGGSVGEKNQIDRFAELGWLGADLEPAATRAALPDPFGSADLASRARSYLDGNCSHCHMKGGYASQSALLLDFPSTDPAVPTASENVGVCKQPTSAGGATCGNVVDIVPGDPAKSIMTCRLDSTDPQVKMPPLGNRLIDAAGVKLIEDWIASLPPTTCP